MTTIDPINAPRRSSRRKVVEVDLSGATLVDSITCGDSASSTSDPAVKRRKNVPAVKQHEIHGKQTTTMVKQAPSINNKIKIRQPIKRKATVSPIANKSIDKQTGSKRSKIVPLTKGAKQHVTDQKKDESSVSNQLSKDSIRKSQDDENVAECDLPSQNLTSHHKQESDESGFKFYDLHDSFLSENIKSPPRVFFKNTLMNSPSFLFGPNYPEDQDLRFGHMDHDLRRMVLQPHSGQQMDKSYLDFEHEFRNNKITVFENSDLNDLLKSMIENIEPDTKLELKNLHMALIGVFRPGVYQQWRSHKRASRRSYHERITHIGRLRPNPRPRRYSDMIAGSDPTLLLDNSNKLLSSVRRGLYMSSTRLTATKKLMRAKTRQGIPCGLASPSNHQSPPPPTSRDHFLLSEPTDPSQPRTKATSSVGSVMARTRRHPDVSHHIDWKFCYADVKKSSTAGEPTGRKAKDSIDANSSDNLADSPNATDGEHLTASSSQSTNNNESVRKYNESIAAATCDSINDLTVHDDTCGGVSPFDDDDDHELFFAKHRAPINSKRRKLSLTVQRKRPTHVRDRSQRPSNRKRRSHEVRHSRMKRDSRHRETSPYSSASSSISSLQRHPVNPNRRWLASRANIPDHRRALSSKSRRESMNTSQQQPHRYHPKQSSSLAFHKSARRHRVSRRSEKMCQHTLLDKLVLGLDCTLTQKDDEIHFEHMRESEFTILTQRIYKTPFNTKSVAVLPTNEGTMYNVVLQFLPSPDTQLIKRPCPLDSPWDAPHDSIYHHHAPSHLISIKSSKTEVLLRCCKPDRLTRAKSLTLFDRSQSFGASRLPLHNGYSSDSELSKQHRKVTQVQKPTNLERIKTRHNRTSVVSTSHPQQRFRAQHSSNNSTEPSGDSRPLHHHHRQRFPAKRVLEPNDQSSTMAIHHRDSSRRQLLTANRNLAVPLTRRHHSPRKVIRKVYTGSSNVPKILSHQRRRGGPSSSNPPASSVNNTTTPNTSCHDYSVVSSACLPITTLACQPPSSQWPSSFNLPIHASSSSNFESTEPTALHAPVAIDGDVDDEYPHSVVSPDEHQQQSPPLKVAVDDGDESAGDHDDATSASSSKERTAKVKSPAAAAPSPPMTVEVDSNVIDLESVTQSPHPDVELSVEGGHSKPPATSLSASQLLRLKRTTSGSPMVDSGRSVGGTRSTGTRSIGQRRLQSPTRSIKHDRSLSPTSSDAVVEASSFAPTATINLPPHFNHRPLPVATSTVLVEQPPSIRHPVMPRHQYPPHYYPVRGQSTSNSPSWLTSAASSTVGGRLSPAATEYPTNNRLFNPLGGVRVVSPAHPPSVVGPLSVMDSQVMSGQSVFPITSQPQINQPTCSSDSPSQQHPAQSTSTKRTVLHKIHSFRKILPKSDHQSSALSVPPLSRYNQQLFDHNHQPRHLFLNSPHSAAATEAETRVLKSLLLVDQQRQAANNEMSVRSPLTLSSTPSPSHWVQPAHQSRGQWQMSSKHAVPPVSGIQQSSRQVVQRGSSPKPYQSSNVVATSVDLNDESSDLSGEGAAFNLHQRPSAHLRLTPGSGSSRLQQLQQHYQRVQAMEQQQQQKPESSQ